LLRRLAQLAFILTLAFPATTLAFAQHGGSTGGGSHGGGMGGSMGGGNRGGSPDPGTTGTDNHDDHTGSRSNRNFPVLTGRHSSIGMGLPTHGMHTMGLPGRWWDDGHTAKSIGLTSDQQKRMDSIFESGKPAILQRFTALQQQQQNLNGMPNKDLSDEDKVYTAIDQVTQARTDLEKTTSQVFTQIRGELTDSQRARLDDAIAKQH
jgi:Spy/CpxP family protein refolding chaperone